MGPPGPLPPSPIVPQRDTMILQPPSRQDFDFQGDIRVDVENKGFTEQEIQKLAGPAPAGQGEKGIGDWWKRIWNPNRPPEIQDLKSEFGYQSAPFLTDLVAVADAQKTPLEGIIKVRSA